MCVRGKGKGGSCDPTAPRPASQAGDTQAHVGAHLTRHELGRSAASCICVSLGVTPCSSLTATHATRAPGGDCVRPLIAYRLRLSCAAGGGVQRPQARCPRARTGSTSRTTTCRSPACRSPSSATPTRTPRPGPSSTTRPTASSLPNPQAHCGAPTRFRVRPLPLVRAPCPLAADDKASPLMTATHLSADNPTHSGGYQADANVRSDRTPASPRPRDRRATPARPSLAYATCTLRLQVTEPRRTRPPPTRPPPPTSFPRCSTAVRTRTSR